MFITIYTRTPDENAPRFDDEEGISWGQMWSPTQETLYGEYIWEMDVYLPDNQEQDYLYTWDVQAGIEDTWLWGQQPKANGHNWVCFRNKLVLEPRLVKRP